MSRIVSDLDPFSPEFRAGPYSCRAAARARPGGLAGTLRHLGGVALRAVKECLTDYGTFSNAGGGGLVNYFVDPALAQTPASSSKSIPPSTSAPARCWAGDVAPRPDRPALHLRAAGRRPGRRGPGRGQVDAVPDLRCSPSR